MAGKKATPVKPAPPSTQRNGSASPGSKGQPKQTSEEASAAAKARPAPKPNKITKEKPAASKKKRDKPEPQDGGKRKKQQASPAKKRKKGDGPEPKSHKEPKPATPSKKQQSSSKPEKPATPSKEQLSPGKPEKPATPAKKHKSPGKPEKPATPAKKQQSTGKAEKPAKKQHEKLIVLALSIENSTGKAAKSAPTLKKQAKGEKPTPTKRKRGDDEAQKEARSPKRASGDGDARASTPVKKKPKDQKAAAADMGACSFPMARVRHLMRAEDATIRASNEAVFLVNKASELFLGKFAEDAYCNTLKDRKKSIIYDNLSTAVCSKKGFKFLSDFVPQRVTAEDALKAAADNKS